MRFLNFAKHLAASSLLLQGKNQVDGSITGCPNSVTGGETSVLPFYIGHYYDTDSNEHLNISYVNHIDVHDDPSYLVAGGYFNYDNYSPKAQKWKGASNELIETSDGLKVGSLTFKNLAGFDEETFIISKSSAQIEVHAVQWLQIISEDTSSVANWADYSQKELLLSAVINDSTNLKSTLVFFVIRTEDADNYIEVKSTYEVAYEGTRENLNHPLMFSLTYDQEHLFAAFVQFNKQTPKDYLSMVIEGSTGSKKFYEDTAYQTDKFHGKQVRLIHPENQGEFIVLGAQADSSGDISPAALTFTADNYGVQITGIRYASTELVEYEKVAYYVDFSSVVVDSGNAIKLIMLLGSDKDNFWDTWAVDVGSMLSEYPDATFVVDSVDGTPMAIACSTVNTGGTPEVYPCSVVTYYSKKATLFSIDYKYDPADSSSSFELKSKKKFFNYSSSQTSYAGFDLTTATAFYSTTQNKVVSYFVNVQGFEIGFNHATNGWTPFDLFGDNKVSMVVSDSTSWSCPGIAEVEETTSSTALTREVGEESSSYADSLTEIASTMQLSETAATSPDFASNFNLWIQVPYLQTGSNLRKLPAGWDKCSVQPNDSELASVGANIDMYYTDAADLARNFVIFARSTYAAESEGYICVSPVADLSLFSVEMTAYYDEDYPVYLYDLEVEQLDEGDCDISDSDCSYTYCKDYDSEHPDGACTFYSKFYVSIKNEIMSKVAAVADTSTDWQVTMQFPQLDAEHDGLMVDFYLTYNNKSGSKSISKSFVMVFKGTGTNPNPAEDAEQSAEDGGQAADDGGQAADDGGQPADDGGQPAEDGGQAADDGGQAADDDGQAADDGGQPADDDGQAADDGGQAADDGGQPADDGGQPAEDGGQAAKPEPGLNKDDAKNDSTFDPLSLFDDLTQDTDDEDLDDTDDDLDDIDEDEDEDEDDLDEDEKDSDVDVQFDCVDTQGFLYDCEDPCYDINGQYSCGLDSYCLINPLASNCTESSDLEELKALKLITDPSAPLGQVTKALSLFYDESKKEKLDKALGLVLGVKNVEQVVAETELVMKISDSTDLKKEAYFDINAFIKERGLIDTRGLFNQKNNKADSAPDFVIENEMAKQFSVPQKVEMGTYGEALFEFREPYEPQQINQILSSILSSLNSERSTEGRRFLESLQSNGDGTANASVDLNQDSLLFPVSQILKVTQSLKCTLIPGDDTYLDEKGFSWELYVYEKKKMGIKFTFKEPEFISVGEPDTMKVEFNNTGVYIPSSSDAIPTMPPGYIITMKIPPQGTNLLSQQEVESAKSQGQAFVIGNLFMSIMLKQTMAMLLGSIVVIQILAHLPLADIFLPANAHQQFDIMISFVSFDYFAPSDYIDFGFSEMPAWSDRFEWLGYENINFVEGMGSIIIFAAISILQILLSLIFVCLRRFAHKNWLQGKFIFSGSLGESLTFIHGTFFEILVCVSISMKMLEYGGFLNSADWTSIYLSFFFGALLISYLAFLIYFSVSKSSLWVTKAKAEKEEKQVALKRSIQKDLLQSMKKKNPKRKLEFKQVLMTSRRSTQDLLERAKTIDETQFEKFSPLVADLRQDSLVSMFNNVFITVRRLLLLYMAMFILNQQWLQVLTFMGVNLISMVFLLVAMPFESKLMNYLSLFNEGFALIMSYLIAQINDMRYEPRTMVVIGYCIVYLIYFSWVINGLIILSVAANEIYYKLRRYYMSKLRWKYECLRPQVKKPKKPAKVFKDSERNRWSEPVKSAKEFLKRPEKRMETIKEESSYAASPRQHTFDPRPRDLFDYQKDGISNTKIPGFASESKQLAYEFRMKQIQNQKCKAEEVDCIVSISDSEMSGQDHDFGYSQRKFVTQDHMPTGSQRDLDKLMQLGDDSERDIPKRSLAPEKILASLGAIQGSQQRRAPERQKSARYGPLMDMRLLKAEIGDNFKPRFLPYNTAAPKRNDCEQRSDSGSPSRNIVLRKKP